MMVNGRLKCSSVFTLMVLQAVVMVLLRLWYFDLSPCSSATSNKKVHVLLLSKGRSGSSFLGQMFNQHSNVFYLMEPAYHVWDTMPTGVGKHQMKMVVRDFLRSMLKCDFPVLDAYIPDNSNVSNLFMWSQSRGLCSPPVCSATPRDQMSDSRRCEVMCDAKSLKLAPLACTTYSHVVYKELRIFELESLYSLLQDPGLDLRIIHLIRDPRATQRSRMESFDNMSKHNTAILDGRNVSKGERDYQLMKEMCRSIVSMHRTATLNPPPFLKGRYRVVRYEDIVLNPVEEIAALYDFVNLEMTPQLEEWIYSMTHGKERSKEDALTVTSRDAISVAQAWRTKLRHSTVKMVQEACEEAMSVFGYKMVDSEEEQKRPDLDLLEPLQ